MRKVVFALFAFAGLLLGCTSVDCSMNNSVAGVYAFLPARNDSLGNWNDSSLTVVVKGIEGEDNENHIIEERIDIGGGMGEKDPVDEEIQINNNNERNEKNSRKCR